MRFGQRFCHCWEHFLNESIGILFRCFVVLCVMVSVSNLFPDNVINPYLVTCDDAFHEVVIRFCLLNESGGDTQAVLLLLNGWNYAETRRMFKSSVKRFGTYRKVFQSLQKFHALLIATCTH